MQRSSGIFLHPQLGNIFSCNFLSQRRIRRCKKSTHSFKHLYWNCFHCFHWNLTFSFSLILKSSSIWKEHLIPFIQTSFLLRKIFRETAIEDNTTARNVEATVLHALPTSTEVVIDLNKPLLLEITADTATFD